MKKIMLSSVALVLLFRVGTIMAYYVKVHVKNDSQYLFFVAGGSASLCPTTLVSGPTWDVPASIHNSCTYYAMSLDYRVQNFFIFSTGDFVQHDYTFFFKTPQNNSHVYTVCRCANPEATMTILYGGDYVYVSCGRHNNDDLIITFTAKPSSVCGINPP